MPRVFRVKYADHSAATQFAQALRQLIDFNRVQRSRGAAMLWRMRRRLRSQNIRVAKQSEAHGFEEGFQAGLQSLASKAHELAKLERTCIRSANKSCLDLSLRVAQQFIGDQIDRNCAHLAAMIKSEIERSTGTRAMRIVAHPSKCAELRAHLGDSASIEIISNSKIESSNARIETAAGVVLLRWQDRFDLLVSALNSQLNEKTERPNVTLS